MDINVQNALKLLKTGNTSIIVLPKNTNGLNAAARFAEKIYDENPQIFWNIPSRSHSDNDAVFLGLVISVLKRRGGQKGINELYDIINFLEKENA